MKLIGSYSIEKEMHIVYPWPAPRFRSAQACLPGWNPATDSSVVRGHPLDLRRTSSNLTPYNSRQVRE